MASKHYAYIFNSPQFFHGWFGHNGVVLENGLGVVHLFSFHPKLNQGESFSKGSVARIMNAADASSFNVFAKACLTVHPGLKTENEDRGILLNNGAVEWIEPIRRLIRMGITENQFKAMLDFAQDFALNPRRFNIITYSCEQFVDQVLDVGGIMLCDKRGNRIKSPIPNVVYDKASNRTKGILSFEKIDLESHQDSK